MKSEHQNDDILLAYMDGELPRDLQRKVECHLQKCWLCRGRLGDLADALRVVARTHKVQGFPGGARISFAKQRLIKRLDREALGDVGERLPGFLSSERQFLPRLAMALSLAVAVAVIAWFSHPSDEPSPLIEAIASEGRLMNDASVQVMSVEYRLVGANSKARMRRISWTGDPRTRRYSFEWRGEGGAVEYAAWQDGAKPMVYEAGVASQAVAREEIADKSSTALWDLRVALTDSNLEQAIWRWFVRNPWTPLTAASGWLALEKQLRSKATVKREAGIIRATLGPAGIAGEPVFSLELDANTLLPQLLEINSSKASIRLRMLERRMIPAQMFHARRFQPSAVLLPESPLPNPTPVELRTSDRVGPLQDVATFLAPLEVSIRYELHNLGRCGTRDIVFEKSPKGLMIEGKFQDPKELEKVRSAIWRASSGAAIVNLTLVESPSSEYETSPSVETSVNEAPLRRSLELRLGASGEGRSGRLRSRVIEIENDILEKSLAIQRELWAVRELAERFPNRSLADLPSGSRALLAAMADDHLRAANEKSKALRLLLSPFLADGNRRTGSTSALGWDEGSRVLVDLASRNLRLVKASFFEDADGISLDSLADEFEAGVNDLVALTERATLEMGLAFGDLEIRETQIRP